MAAKRDLLGTKAPIPEEVQEAANALRALVEKNVSKTGYLDRCQVQVDPMAVFVARVEFIIDHIYPVNTPERLEFETLWQGKVAEVLDEYEGMLNRARLQGAAPAAPTLAENVQQGAGLILPGK